MSEQGICTECGSDSLVASGVPRARDVDPEVDLLDVQGLPIDRDLPDEQGSVPET